MTIGRATEAELRIADDGISRHHARVHYAGEIASVEDLAERIEVLKGPAALLYGMSPNSGVGGVINVVPKRAGDDLSSFTASYASDTQFGGHLDDNAGRAARCLARKIQHARLVQRAA